MANKTASEKNKPKRRTLKDNEYFNPKTQRYEYRYTDVAGKVHVVSSYKLLPTDQVSKGKRDCKSLREKEAEVNELLQSGLDVDGAQMKLAELVAMYTEQYYAKGKLAGSTRSAYRCFVDGLRRTAIGNTPVAKIKLIHGERWVMDMRSRLRCSTINRYIGIVRCALEYAVDCEYITKNPFRNLSVSARSDRRINALTYDEMTRFLEFCRTDKHASNHYDALYFLFWTGLRVSEFCGLTLDDIDMENRIIYVRRQLHRVGDRLLVTQTKTRSGVRCVPMLDGVYECLQRVLTRRAKVVKTEEPRYDEDGTPYTRFVFLGYYRHTPLERSTVTSFLSSCIKWYNQNNPDEQLRQFYPHVCRHTFATNMQSLPPKTLQTIMGHSDIGTTMNTYVDANPVAQQLIEMKKTAESLG